jgi:CBS domain-containing protein
MTEKLICCHVNDDARTAAEIMRANNFHQLPVVDEGNHLVGIVSLGDVQRGT